MQLAASSVQICFILFISSDDHHNIYNAFIPLFVSETEEADGNT